jgi:hypothetical protein
LVSGAVSARETDWGGVIFGVWDIFRGAGVGAEGVVVCVGDFGVGGDFDLVCGASVEEQPREVITSPGTRSASGAANNCKLRIANRKSSYNLLDGLSGD